MPGHLFTEYFLTDGIRQTPERQSQRPAFVAFRDAARRLFQDFAVHNQPNESQTEQDLIRPLLQRLGWTDDLPQAASSGGENIPDLLLFRDAEAKTRATSSEASPYLDALAVAELKRFRRPLDSRGPGKGTQASSPHAQILRYLRDAEIATDGNLRWGILTNGAVWRLYDQRTRPRATAFYEADLQAILEADDQDALRTFHLLFRRPAFLRRPGAAATFVEAALDEGKRYEQRVAQSLAGVVFERVFPRLLQALVDTTDRPMSEIRQATLIFLYRLLFILYAEDRGLLPVNDAAYDDYGLRKRVRDDIAKRKDRNDTFSTVASSYNDHLTTLFRLIDRGDPSIGLPPYNGGLFAQDAAALLNDARLPDDVIADVVHDLSHTRDNGQRSYVNYRDMSVQQLGSLYERLLEQQPELEPDGKVRIRPNPYARKDSGSFYTPQDLVDLIVDQTIKPLIEERLDSFEARANDLRSDRRPRSERRAELARLDPAQAVLDLKVLDPAMGSGHFLVTAVDFLTDYVADLIEVAPAFADWLPQDDPYQSPLLDRIAAIRADILRRANESGWKVNEAQLTDQAIIRRLVLKRCIYGVDKNPLTVELAKVSLWLHSFTVGAPLSFLDHHLRCGDSLLGLRIADATADLRRLKVPMFVESALQGVENAAQGMRQIEELSDADVTEVHESQSLFHAVESATANLRGFLDTLAGLRWHTAGMKVRQRATLEAPIAETLGADPSQAFALLSQGAGSSSPVGVPLVGTQSLSAPTVRGEPGRSLSQARVEPHPPGAAPNPDSLSSPSSVGAASLTRLSSGRDPQNHDHLGEPAISQGNRPLSPLPVGEGQGEGLPGNQPEFGNQPTAKSTDPAFTTLLNQSKSIANEESFLHWEAAFPSVWRHWQDQTPEGGFDAVIGNPPWDRIKLQEVEWFATRDPDLARAPTAAARREGIKRLRERGDPLAHAFDQAKARADRLGQVIRASGHYPLLGGGDINLYSLFVERSLRLVKPNGLVGLLTPSGIYADRTAARFFQSVSTTGRVAGIYDFENRKIFFKDIHASFKFCALIVGGPQRTFPETRCAFFLHDTDAIKDPDRTFALTANDFARVNPNTGTAPVFRTRRAADVTRRIYQDHPVFVDRSSDQERRAWPARYANMFHMANDSHLFRTTEQLEAQGFYPIQGNRWKRGQDLFLPLYEGKMVQAFDHRAADTRTVESNLFRPGQQDSIPDSEKADCGRLPIPRYFVKLDGTRWPWRNSWIVAYKNVTATTNVRTMIAAVIPKLGAGHSLNLLPVIDDDIHPLVGCMIVSNLNAFVFDFVARQKVPGNNFTLYLLEQLPVIAPNTYDRRFGDRTAADLIRDHVLRLTYTSHDMAPFARDLGHHGPPFPWDPEQRRHLRARLDALYFHLYGLTRDDARYILSTFPIIQRQDEAEFDGRYRTKDLILAYMNALAAGDTESQVTA
ncbi:MAG: restriction endonuclease [Chloroflexi bacterium]|nr:restriction endonuclease [Chloroflexota bacterium]